jgi:hypothetical protein
MRIEQVLKGPGQYIYKVFTSRDALVYHGTILSVAQEMYEIGEQQELEEKRRAELARKTSSDRSSD